MLVHQHLLKLGCCIVSERISLKNRGVCVQKVAAIGVVSRGHMPIVIEQVSRVRRFIQSVLDRRHRVVRDTFE